MTSTQPPLVGHQPFAQNDPQYGPTIVLTRIERRPRATGRGRRVVVPLDALRGTFAHEREGPSSHDQAPFSLPPSLVYRAQTGGERQTTKMAKTTARRRQGGPAAAGAFYGDLGYHRPTAGRRPTERPTAKSSDIATLQTCNFILAHLTRHALRRILQRLPCTL